MCSASRLVEVDQKEEMVRPNPNRCAVILRDIPEDVKQEVWFTRSATKQ